MNHNIYKALKLSTKKIDSVPMHEVDKVLKDNVTDVVLHTRGPRYESVEVKFIDEDARKNVNGHRKYKHRGPSRSTGENMAWTHIPTI